MDKETFEDLHLIALICIMRLLFPCLAYDEHFWMQDVCGIPHWLSFSSLTRLEVDLIAHDAPPQIKARQLVRQSMHAQSCASDSRGQRKATSGPIPLVLQTMRHECITTVTTVVDVKWAQLVVSEVVSVEEQPCSPGY